MHRTAQCKRNSAPWFLQYVENILTSLLAEHSQCICHDAAYDSLGSSSCAPHADQHPPGNPANQAQCWLSCRPCYKKGGFLANWTNHWRRMSLIISVGSLLLSALVFQVRRHSLTLQFHAELHFDHEISLTGHSFAANQCWTSFSFVFTDFFNGVWQGWQYCGNIK